MVTQFLPTTGLKEKWILEARSENVRVWKMSIFGSEVGSGFGEPGETPPPRIPGNTSRPPGGDLILLYRSEF